VTRNRSSQTAQKKLIGLINSKLYGAEVNVTLIEKKLLVIIKALRHFKSPILGAEITVMIDHKNLTYITFCEDNRAQRWRILIDEYTAVLTYIERNKNIEP
jgi:hypothetical protein